MALALARRHLRVELAATYAFPQSVRYSDPQQVGARFDLRGGELRGCHAVAVKVLHHMKLYEHRGALPEGVSEGAPTPAESRLVHSWTAGMAGLELDPALGIPVAADTWYTLSHRFHPRLRCGSATDICA